MQKSKIACISDIHLGVHQDSQLWHKLHLDLALWIKNSLQREGIKRLLIAGDVFHNRHEVNVATLHTAKLFFDILKDFEIDVITGNHDCYYRDNSNVNSISILNNSDNVRVHEKLSTFTFNKKRFALCPWGTELQDIPECDIVVGHFELLNFKMNGSIYCDHGWESSSVLEQCKLILTGHFHTRQQRIYEDGKTVLYTGSPLQLDWGDREGSKGITILDTDTMVLDLIENNTSPVHEKFEIADLQNGKIKIQTLKKLLNNNHAKIVVSSHIESSNVDLLLSKLNTMSPLQLHVEYENNIDIKQLECDSDNSEKIVSIESVLKEFIDSLDTSVSKKHVYDKCLELYKIVQTQK
jgi:DNA repair exonuclease SbcCD nuclease subunit